MKISKLKSVRKIDHDSNRYDIEVANTSNFFADGVLVHNSFCAMSYIPGLNHTEAFDGNFIVYSKGLGAQGLVFKDNEKNANNAYVKMFKQYKQNILDVHDAFGLDDTTQITILGEVFGPVQDLKYSFSDLQFRVFDVYIGRPRYSDELSWFVSKGTTLAVCKSFGIPTVPLLYQGPFSAEMLELYTNGVEQVSGTEAHIREGVVVSPIEERQCNTHRNNLGRVLLKSVSNDYLLRKSSTATEYN
jgi:RNA ligase (TIGR02306 family)